MPILTARRAWRAFTLAGCMLAGALGPGGRYAVGQAMLADDVIVLSKGQRARKQAQSAAQQGGQSGVLGASPGSGVSRLGGPAGPPATNGREARAGALGVLSAASGYSTAFSGRQEVPRLAPLSPAPTPRTPQYGDLELPGPEDAGPPNGLTLDQAIQVLVQSNPDLAAKAQEIPKAEADTLTAGLRANPIVFASADAVPYGGYSPQRPGNNSYGVVLIQPIDVNRKRAVRVVVAEQARQVIHAQYQDAVRVAIDQLGTTFVDVLEARELVRYTQANIDRLNDLVDATRLLLRKSSHSRPDLDRALILHDAADVELATARSSLRQAKRSLATLLNLPPGNPDAIEVHGTTRDTAPPPLPINDLVHLALCVRPDVVSYRLGVQRAMTDVRLARAERFEDVFLFYTPYGFNNYSYQHEQSATSWSLGGMVVLPVFNRNQGNIARAQGTVLQTQIELGGIERQVVNEVERAVEDYQVTLAAVRRTEQDILPRARRFRDDQYRLFKAGEVDVTTYFNAQREYNDIVRQFRDSLVRHRRAMLKINTAVGQRILP
ncbi:MAG: TolC family protein [Isosphaeraceae bacterium]|nr:TolC family protein [Isosphaeraceae bacterium]